MKGAYSRAEGRSGLRTSGGGGKLLAYSGLSKEEEVVDWR